MWYFSWILGLSLACAFGVLNALWLELSPGDVKPADAPAPSQETLPSSSQSL